MMIMLSGWTIKVIGLMVVWVKLIVSRINHPSIRKTIQPPTGSSFVLLQTTMSISASITDRPDASSPERKANKVKFELELEMMLSLANPHYLLELSSTGYLDSEPFLNFIEYLAYWEKPEFARFIIYPNSLHHRRILLKPLFRQALKTQGHALVQKLADAQYEHWVSWRADKSKPPFEDGPPTATTST